MDYQFWFDKIYTEVFCKTFSESYYIFLCGGAGENCIRNAVRKRLEKDGYQILYPEDLFVETIYKDKTADLLSYENLLADNADVVCVLCESPGSFAEIGAFVQSKSINQRLVIAINNAHKRDKSFIILGPVRHLYKINHNAIVYYKKSDIPNTVRKIRCACNNIKRKVPHEHKSIEFSQLSAHIAFIPILLFFFRNISRGVLYTEFKNFLNTKNIFPKNYNLLFNSAIKYLLKTKIISINYFDNIANEEISITKYGDEKIKQIISKSVLKGHNSLHDKIRCGIMKSQLNN